MAREVAASGRDRPARGGWPAADAVPSPDLIGDRSLRAEVEGYLLRAIRGGGLRAGERIREGEIAAALGISETPVREAILRLVHGGVIEHRPRRGFFLQEMTLAAMDDLYCFRAVLEGLAARLAAVRIEPAEVAALWDLVAAGGRAEQAGQSLASVEVNARLHAAIVRAARHPFLDRTWQMLAPLQWLPRDFTAGIQPRSADLAGSWVDTHRRLVEVIAAGDAEGAEAAAREHVLAAGRVALPVARRRDGGKKGEGLSRVGEGLSAGRRSESGRRE